MALFTKPSNVNKVWSSGGDIIDPGDSKIASGWEVEIPPRQYFNYIDNKQDQFIAHVNQLGIPVWDSTTEYQADKSYTQGATNGVVYRCVQTHTNQDPETDVTNTYWDIAFADANDFYTKAETDNLYLAKSQNLADLPNSATARTNLSVYSKTEADALNKLDTVRIDVPSASTVNLTSLAPNTRHINITGTTTINSFTVASGLCYFVRFNASLTLTNGASLVTQSGADVVTNAGDTCIIRATAANTVEILSYSRFNRLVLAGSQSASGTSVDFTNIPSWVRRITFMAVSLSSNGTSDIIIQLGTSGGVEVTNYLGAIGRAGNVSANFSDGFAIQTAMAATDSYHGHCVLTKLSSTSNTWVASLCFGDSESADSYSGGGSKSLGGTLDRLRLTTSNGTDTFDAGTINILYE